MIHRIAIVGGPGTGKTTLSNLLGTYYSLPVIHLDAIQYLENWKVRDESERNQMIIKQTQKEDWIIDGIYHHTLNERFKRADLIIWLDYSTFSQIKGILKRYFKEHGKERKEIPKCKERLTFTFLKYVFFYNFKKRHYIIDTLESTNTKEKTIIFKNRRQLTKWLNTKKA